MMQAYNENSYSNEYDSGGSDIHTHAVVSKLVQNMYDCSSFPYAHPALDVAPYTMKTLQAQFHQVVQDGDPDDGMIILHTNTAARICGTHYIGDGAGGFTPFQMLYTGQDLDLNYTKALRQTFNFELYNATISAGNVALGGTVVGFQTDSPLSELLQVAPLQYDNLTSYPSDPLKVLKQVALFDGAFVTNLPNTSKLSYMDLESALTNVVSGGILNPVVQEYEEQSSRKVTANFGINVAGVIPPTAFTTVGALNYPFDSITGLDIEGFVYWEAFAVTLSSPVNLDFIVNLFTYDVFGNEINNFQVGTNTILISNTAAASSNVIGNCPIQYTFVPTDYTTVDQRAITNVSLAISWRYRGSAGAWTSLTAGTMQIQSTIRSPAGNMWGNNYPNVILGYRGLQSGADLQLVLSSNFKAIPNAKIAQEVLTVYPRHEQGDIDAVEGFLALSTKQHIPTLLSRRHRDWVLEHIDRGYLQYNPSLTAHASIGDFFKKVWGGVKKVFPKVAPIIGTITDEFIPGSGKYVNEVGKLVARASLTKKDEVVTGASGNGNTYFIADDGTLVVIDRNDPSRYDELIKAVLQKEKPSQIIYPCVQEYCKVNILDSFCVEAGEVSKCLRTVFISSQGDAERYFCDEAEDKVKEMKVLRRELIAKASMWEKDPIFDEICNDLANLCEDAMLCSDDDEIDEQIWYDNMNVFPYCDWDIRDYHERLVDFDNHKRSLHARAAIMDQIKQKEARPFSIKTPNSVTSKWVDLAGELPESDWSEFDLGDIRTIDCSGKTVTLFAVVLEDSNNVAKGQAIFAIVPGMLLDREKHDVGHDQRGTSIFNLDHNTKVPFCVPGPCSLVMLASKPQIDRKLSYYEKSPVVVETSFLLAMWVYKTLYPKGMFLVDLVFTGGIMKDGERYQIITSSGFEEKRLAAHSLGMMLVGRSTSMDYFVSTPGDAVNLAIHINHTRYDYSSNADRKIIARAMDNRNRDELWVRPRIKLITPGQNVARPIVARAMDLSSMVRVAEGLRVAPVRPMSGGDIKEKLKEMSSTFNKELVNATKLENIMTEDLMIATVMTIFSQYDGVKDLVKATGVTDPTQIGQLLVNRLLNVQSQTPQIEYVTQTLNAVPGGAATERFSSSVRQMFPDYNEINPKTIEMLYQYPVLLLYDDALQWFAENGNKGPNNTQVVMLKNGQLPTPGGTTIVHDYGRESPKALRIAMESGPLSRESFLSGINLVREKHDIAQITEGIKNKTIANEAAAKQRITQYQRDLSQLRGSPMATKRSGFDEGSYLNAIRNNGRTTLLSETKKKELRSFVEAQSLGRRSVDYANLISQFVNRQSTGAGDTNISSTTTTTVTNLRPTARFTNVVGTKTGNSTKISVPHKHSDLNSDAEALFTAGEGGMS